MVFCTDGTYYVGVTNDLERRIGEHNFGIDPAYSQDFGFVWDAIDAEKKIKRWSHSKKSALARGDWQMISRLANPRRRVDTL